MKKEVRKEILSALFSMHHVNTVELTRPLGVFRLCEIFHEIAAHIDMDFGRRILVKESFVSAILELVKEKKIVVRNINKAAGHLRKFFISHFSLCIFLWEQTPRL